MRILFVAEQYVPPVRSGSALVYKAWLDALTARHEVVAVLFASEQGDRAEAEAYLAERCRAFAILPGVPESRLWKTARATSRYATGALFAPPWIEEWGRRPIGRRIERLLAAHPPELALFSKPASVSLFGRTALRRLRMPRLLDLHDDFVEREKLERHALDALLRRHPALREHPATGRLALRNRLSRFDESASRRQESRYFRYFDRILVSSIEEFERYRTVYPEDRRFRHQPWPIAVEGAHAERVPRYDAGMIASDAVFNIEGFLHFHRLILPAIRAARPSFRLLVAGGLARALQVLARSWPGIDLVPSVPEIGDFYADIRVALVPLVSGTGVSLKTLEALGFGLPVVALPRGARGLEAGGFGNLVVADHDGSFAAAVLQALDAPPPSATDMSRLTASALDRFEALVASLPAPRRRSGSPTTAFAGTARN